MKKNHIVIFTGLTLTILNLIANESIEDSIIEFNSNPELYPPFKVSLIVFLNNKISTESKKEQFLDLERFIYKTERIIQRQGRNDEPVTSQDGIGFCEIKPI